MTRQEIIDNNKLIADFCGFHYITGEGWILKKYQSLNELTSIQSKVIYDKVFLARHHRDLRYYNDWNWLINVIDSIEELGYRFQIGTKYVFVWYNGRQEYLCGCYDGKKKATYHAIIEFIKWYNNK